MNSYRYKFFVFQLFLQHLNFHHGTSRLSFLAKNAKCFHISHLKTYLWQFFTFSKKIWAHLPSVPTSFCNIYERFHLHLCFGRSVTASPPLPLVSLGSRGDQRRRKELRQGRKKKKESLPTTRKIRGTGICVISPDYHI